MLTGKGDGYTPRRIDIPCRWGGEEFIMLFDETNEAGATSAAERISAAIKKLRFTDGNSGEEFGITVTVGMVGVRTAEVREIPRETDLLAHYFELADRALYFGKRNGRDQIVSYEAGKTDPENFPAEPSVRQTAKRTSRSVTETIEGTSANRKFGKKKTAIPVRGRAKIT